MLNKQKQKERQRPGDIIKQLGPIQEVNVRLKLPTAFVEYIEERKRNGTLDEYCNEEILMAMISSLDDNEEMVLQSYIIPPFLANYMGYIVGGTLSKMGNK